jgi:hypothetical protein
MKLGTRDRRALALLGAAALVIVVLELVVARRQEAPSVSSTDTVETVQNRLLRLRQAASTLPARQTELRIAAEDLARREKRMIQADTLPQAQAQLLQVVRRLSAGQSPPIDIRSAEVGQARPLGDDYGEIFVPISFECRIEQLVNLLADVTSQPELLAVSGLRVNSGNPKEKTVNVRLTLAAVVPRKLVPEKKGGGLL